VFGGHWIYLAILLVVVLIIFGPGRLPELGGAVGKAMREFRKATTELTDQVKESVDAKPQPAAKVESSAPSTSEPKGPSTSN
jgi:sec-independent protein translocase protein TatA